MNSDGHNSTLKQKSVEFVESKFGRIEAYSDDIITQQIKGFGNHTRPEFAFATAALDYSMNVFDLGAHIGTFSMAVLAKIQRNQRLLSVEGSPTTFSILKRNCATLGVANVDLVNGFVGESVGFAYSESKENTGGSRLVRAQQGQNTVDFMSIDKLAKKYFVPDYIKIDIEGAEYDAFKNCKVLRQHTPIIYMEMSAAQLAEFGHSISMMNELMKDIGYSFFVNIGERNARHDFFQVKEIESLDGFKPFFDVLCIPSNSNLLASLRRISKGL